MMRTILTASHISVQGKFVKSLADGRVEVRVGDRYYVGKPVKFVRPKPRLVTSAEAV